MADKEPDVAKNTIYHQEYEDDKVMENIETNVPTDSAEQIVDEKDTDMNIRQSNEMADNEMDVATSPVDQTANKEDTATNSKSGTKKITIGQYIGKYKTHTNMHTSIEYIGEAQIQQDFMQDQLKIKMSKNQVTQSIDSRTTRHLHG